MRVRLRVGVGVWDIVRVWLGFMLKLGPWSGVEVEGEVESDDVGACVQVRVNGEDGAGASSSLLLGILLLSSLLITSQKRRKEDSSPE